MSVNTLAPHEYRVHAWALKPKSGYEQHRTILIKAWTAEDACVQAELELCIRGRQDPEWRIATVEPYYLNPGEVLIGDTIRIGP